MFIQTLYGIRDVHKSGIGEEDFSEVSCTLREHVFSDIILIHLNCL